MKNVQRIITRIRYEAPLLFILFVIALLLRSLYVLNNHISFHYDMARDAFTAQQIWLNHDLKIIGPPSSFAGFFHGVLYYYLIAPFYMLGNGNPQYPSLFLAFLNCLTIFPLFLLAKKVIKSPRWALLSVVLYAFSYEAIQYGPWLSNPGPALLFITLFFLGLFYWQEDKHWGLPLAVFSAAIATQFQLFLFYLLILIPIFSYVFKISTPKKYKWSALFLGLLGLSTYFIAIIKFGTLGTTLSSVFKLLLNQNETQNQFTGYLFNYVNRIANLFTNNYFPVNVFLGGLLGIFVFLSCRKNKFLLFILLSGFIIYFFGGHNSNYGNIGFLVPSVLGVSYMLSNLSPRYRIIGAIVGLIIIANTFSLISRLSMGQSLLVIPKDMILSKQLQLIDTTYKIANGAPFSINSSTLPSRVNTTWAYLYSWYGKNKYGYLPDYYGHDQIDLPGDKLLNQQHDPLPLSFLIIEPNIGIPTYIRDWELNEENGKTITVKEYNYGELTLQLRTPR